MNVEWVKFRDEWPEESDGQMILMANEYDTFDATVLFFNERGAQGPGWYDIDENEIIYERQYLIDMFWLKGLKWPPHKKAIGEE